MCLCVECGDDSQLPAHSCTLQTGGRVRRRGARRERGSVSKFQLEGVFWDATSPDDKFAGTLSCDGKRLELVTRAELVTPTPAMFMETDEAPVPDIVHGFTSNGDCTIIGLQQINTPGLLDYSRARG